MSNFEKRLERLEKTEHGKNPDLASMVFYHVHVCSEPAPEAGQPERDSPVCADCGQPLRWVFGAPPEGAETIIRLPDNGRD